MSDTATAASLVQVDPLNFVRAESDLYMGKLSREVGPGKLFHHREPTPIDKQDVIRMNRDTLYSSIVLDLEAAPATITLPDSGKRFMSLQIIDQDHYTHGVHYEPKPVRLTRDAIGTRYVQGIVRTLVDASDPADSVNNVTAKPNADGSVTVQLGGSPNDAPNVIPITPGWNYTVRLYRPRPEIASGRWQFPEPQVI